jgi:hypothetical protein
VHIGDKPWTARYLGDFGETLGGMSSQSRQAVETAVAAVLVDPYAPRGYRIAEYGYLFRRWPRYRLTMPGLATLTYAPIEAAPPVFFKVVNFETLMLIVRPDDGPVIALTEHDTFAERPRLE